VWTCAHAGIPQCAVPHMLDQFYWGDRTGKPVLVVAPCSLLVLSVNTGWKAGSAIRGGNYVWGLATQTRLLVYFAHLDSVGAEPGGYFAPGTAPSHAIVLHGQRATWYILLVIGFCLVPAAN